METKRRLIDANALLEDFGEEPMVWNEEDAEVQERNDWHRYRVIVKCQPIVDAVEVVRCRDCKYQSKVWVSDKRMKENGYFIYGCKYQEFGELGEDDDFCSYGERRTDV